MGENLTRRSLSILAVTLVACAASTALGQGFWEKKDFEKWSQGECQKLLSDSPWAKSYTLSRVLVQTLQEQAAVPGRATNPQITYLIQFWSARPIRQALIQQGRVSEAAARMSEEQKAALKQREARFLANDFADLILVDLTYSTNTQGLEQELNHYWDSRTQEEIKQFTYIVAGGHRINPKQVNISKSGRRDIQLLFPRQVDGQALVTPQDKRISVEFEAPPIGIFAGQRILIEFYLTKMSVDGKPAY